MKKWFWITMILTCVFVLAACAEKENDTANPTPANEAEGMPDIEVNEETNTESEAEEAEDTKATEGTEKGAVITELMPVTVKLNDANGESVGTAELIEEEETLRIKVDVSNLTEGTHGFHFHEKGVCEGPDFESAGGHFNPTESSHGLAHEEGPHAGDLPNLVVGPDGTMVEEYLVENLKLRAGEENSLFQEGGTSLIIHAEPDDGISQPSGNSGDRIACGVIE